MSAVENQWHKPNSLLQSTRVVIPQLEHAWDSLEGLLKHWNPWLHPQSSWFSRFGARPQNVHFQQALRWDWCCWSREHILGQRTSRALSTHEAPVSERVAPMTCGYRTGLVADAPTEGGPVQHNLVWPSGSLRRPKRTFPSIPFPGPGSNSETSTFCLPTGQDSGKWLLGLP